MGKYGLSGDIGFVGPNLHIAAPFDSNGGVWVVTFSEEEGLWRKRVAKEDVGNQMVISCALCDSPAVSLDHYWPYYQDMNRCEKHYGKKNKGESMTLDLSQQAAVDRISSLSTRVNLLIGAGGSGKTYTIRHLLQKLWDDDTNEITDETTYIAAPTGKAAKVLADAFTAEGFRVFNEPKTIHRMLEFRPALGFTRNADNPLDAALCIIDEASMVDSDLLARVIVALPEECYLILVGDENQLPPVAPGAPFTDLINHGRQEIINRLTTNHRQTAGSLIANGCLQVLAGAGPTFGQRGQKTLGGSLYDDMFFLEEEDKEEIPRIVGDLTEAWHKGGKDYVVLAPQKTGVCGVDAINKYLQERLNPAAPGKPELRLGWLTLREGDKVLQTKNNYALGVFNGFCGVVTAIDPEEGVVVVEIDGETYVYEEPDHIKQLALGYCMTVHKSQGSQFANGVLICHSSHYYMWSRSILYTGISRFREELWVVGDRKAMKRGVSNVVSGERNTLIKLRLSGEEV